jgi:hypothetical protein
VTTPPDDGALPVPGWLADAATYALANGLVDLETHTLTSEGRRVLVILGAATNRSTP